MTMNPVGRMSQNTPQSLIEEFLAKGNAITKCPAGGRTENIEYTGGFYGRGRKKKEPASTEEPIEPTDEES